MEQEQQYTIHPDMDITTFYKTISAKGKVVMKVKRAAGERMHLAPLGYKNARDVRGRSILVPDPETFQLVQVAKRLHTNGKSIREICKIMEKAGLRSQRGKIIGPSSMLKLLR